MPSSDNGPELGSLADVLKSRAPRAALAAATAQLLYPVYLKARKHAEDRRTFTVKFPAVDDLYDDLHEWVLSRLPEDKRQALVAYTAHVRSGAAEPDSDYERSQPDQPDRALRLRYDGARRSAITVGGHKVLVAVTEYAPGSGDKTTFTKPPEVMFTARSIAGRDAVIRQIESLLEKSRKAHHQPSLRMLGSWGDWSRHDEMLHRSLDSVILREGQIERLAGDVGRFLSSEAEYMRKGVPWHRGHLYEGPPGTGKTSVARAIACHFGMDVWYLPLSSIRMDRELMGLIASITPRSMLLLEDVDVFHAATERNDKQDGVTLSGLLNSLDGVASPHGLFTVLTTNVPDVLDQALMRPGRVDLKEHFGLADASQVRRLVSRWYDKPVGEITDPLPEISPGDVTEICKRSDTAEGALFEILCPRILEVRAPGADRTAGNLGHSQS